MRLLSALALFLALGACATPEPAADLAPADAPPTGPIVSVADLLAQSPASDWRPLNPENTLYVELPGGRVIIELAPDFAPNHAASIRALAREHYHDGAYVLRAQDNYVVQWGWPDGEEKPMRTTTPEIPGEISRPIGDLDFTAIPDPDTYAPVVGFSNGFPVAENESEAWLTHCYGMVGAARGMGADSGGAGQLYVIIGHSPRHLDRNITLVGRVIQGVELLSSMRRGTGELGFYETAPERTQIRSVRLAADVPAAERTNLEILRTDSGTFGAFFESRRWRREEWFLDPTGHIGVCNVNVPVRAAR